MSGSPTDFVFDENLKNWIVEFLGELPWKHANPIIQSITRSPTRSGAYLLSREMTLNLLNDCMLKNQSIRAFELVRRSLEEQLQKEQQAAAESLQRQRLELSRSQSSSGKRVSIKEVTEEKIDMRGKTQEKGFLDFAKKAGKKLGKTATAVAVDTVSETVSETISEAVSGTNSETISEVVPEAVSGTISEVIETHPQAVIQVVDEAAARKTKPKKGKKRFGRVKDKIKKIEKKDRRGRKRGDNILSSTSEESSSESLSEDESSSDLS